MVFKMEAMLRLFKSLPVHQKGLTEHRETPPQILKDSLKRGFIFSPDVVSHFSDEELQHHIEVISDEIGLTVKQMNSTFHKSWKKVSDAPKIQLIIEQLIHYITTYGYESFGIDYTSSDVYIPNEKLNLPRIESDIKLTVIHGLTPDEAKEKILTMLSSGIALSEDTIEDLAEVSSFAKISADDLSKIKNKEFRAIMLDNLDILPDNPVECLRLIIYKLTDSALLIKSNALISKIEDIYLYKHISVTSQLRISKVESIFKRYDLSKLSQIFYRYKPLFLAMRKDPVIRPYINILRRLAKKNHKPMKPDLLNEVTALIKNNGKLSKKKLLIALDNANVFRKVRLAYALNFRASADHTSITYRIRNGKSYSKKFEFNNISEAIRLRDIVIDSIAYDVGKNVRDKKIYLPDNVVYSLPSTEKMFSGDIPAGSYIPLPKDAVIGVHWENMNLNGRGYRVDLDLSLMGTDGKIGWDGEYRNDESTVLFSGDITDAPKSNGGATEAFYISKDANRDFAMMLNVYYKSTYPDTIPFKLIIANEKPTRRTFEHNYTVNPNDVVTIVPSAIMEGQKMIGLIDTTDKETCSRFYFTEFKMDRHISASTTKHGEHARKFIKDYYKDTLSLRDILEKGDATFVDNADDADIDLSIENMDRSKIIGILKG